jgi:hypothetical protein
MRRFGIGAWDGLQWILPSNSPRYDAGLSDQTTFAEWYACPGGRIEPGKPAVSPENWAGNHTRRSFRQKWFFVGKDDQCKSATRVRRLLICLTLIQGPRRNDFFDALETNSCDCLAPNSR